MNSVRAERAGELENAMLDMMVRDAVEVFDRDRADHAEALFGALNDNPRSYTRQLKRMPEGVNLMLAAWRTLRDDLARVGRNAWGISHLGRAACLTGVRVEQGYTTRFGDLSNALWGDFDGLGDHEGGDLDNQGRRDWARARLGELVEAEIAGLEAHRKTLDLKRIASNRREVPARARFDDSAEGALLKRYEADADRALYKALKEYRQVEAEADARPEADAQPEVPDAPKARMGSFREPGSPADCDRSPAFLDAPKPENPVVRGPDGLPLSIKRPLPTPL